jgi:hypothetical protein
MRIIAFIEDSDMIEKILKHPKLWDIRHHDPPMTNKNDHLIVESEVVYDDYFSQLPAADAWVV